jgi:hypothetical protein
MLTPRAQRGISRHELHLAVNGCRNRNDSAPRGLCVETWPLNTPCEVSCPRIDANEIVAEERDIEAFTDH